MKNRSVVELMVLFFTFVVGISILVTSFMIVFIEVRNPDADTDRVTATLMSLISSILGALLGLIAGRATSELHTRDSGQRDDLGKPP